MSIIRTNQKLTNVFNDMLESLSVTRYTEVLNYQSKSKRALDFIGDVLNFCYGVVTDHILDNLVTSKKELENTLPLSTKVCLQR